MITVSPECFPCFFRQADMAALAHGAPDPSRRTVAGRVAGILTDIPEGEVPARIATRLHGVVREVLGTDDPFRALKDREIRDFAETASRAESLVSSAADPMAAAVWMSVFGNIMDSGIVRRESMEDEVSRLSGEIGSRRLPERLRDRILSSRTVGVLLDNTGEAAYDVPLLCRLAGGGRRLWIGVKGGPVIDDLTEEEARLLELSSYGEIVSNGNRNVGTDLPACSGEFRERVAGSDLILSKGQANFETLFGHLRNAYFLFRCKCPVVSRVLGRSEGDLIVMSEEGVA